MATREKIAGVRSDEIGRPVGAYRVELLDRHTSKVRERVEVANYIAPTSLDFLRWTQGNLFHNGLRKAHLGDASHAFPDSISEAGLQLPPVVPNEFIFGTDSTTAEDPTSSWSDGKVIGYASRWKSGIPASGPRGLINEAQSEIGLDSAKVVFDFNENQGNGSIESIGIGRIVPGYYVDTQPALSCVTGRSVRLGNFDRQLIDANYACTSGIDWANKKLRVMDHSPPRIAEVDFSAVVPDDQGFYDLSVLTGSDVTFYPTLPGVSFASNSTTATSALYYIDRHGWDEDGSGNVYLAHGPRRGDLIVRQWDKATSAAGWSTAPVSLSGSTGSHALNYDVAVCGTYVFAVVQTPSATVSHNDASKNVWRLDLADGTVSATIPLGNDSEGNPIYSLGSIASDGTDLYVSTTYGILKMSTAGAFLGWLGRPTNSGWDETGIAPWATNTGYQDLQSTGADRYSAAFTYGTTTSASDRYFSSVPESWQGTRIIFSDGKLWVHMDSTGDHRWASIDGRNTFSRALLDTTVNKTTSSTMKWTYELTLPDEWRKGGDGLVHPPVVI